MKTSLQEKFNAKVSLIKTAILGLRIRHLEHEITQDSPTAYACFLGNSDYILECAVQEKTDFAPYYQVMLALATVESGQIAYWYDDEETSLDELKEALLNFLRCFVPLQNGSPTV